MGCEKHGISGLILDPLSVTEEPHSGSALKRFKVREPMPADVAKLVDARDLKSLGENCTGSIPVVRTNCTLGFVCVTQFIIRKCFGFAFTFRENVCVLRNIFQKN